LSFRSEVITAIQQRRVVELRYDNDAADRTVHPHVVYRTATGKECLDAYQVRGPTSSGSLPDWRLFDLARIRRVEVLSEEFAPAPGYDPNGRKYRHGVIARLRRI
jgi:hypothetical protein